MERERLALLYLGLSPDTIEKYRERVIEAIASHRCSTDLTDGFCGPRDGKCSGQGGERPPHRNCCTQARGILAAIESVGMSVIWTFDKRRVEMPLFMCRKCGSVENTALSEYWRQEMEAHEKGTPLQPLCSACHPEIGEWHGAFERKRADGYVIDRRGRYIYSSAEIEKGYFKDHGPFRPVELPAGLAA